jgi:hypothetical protein
MDLKSPLRLWDHEGGECGRQRAVDGNGDLWIESSCARGDARFDKSRPVTADELKKIETAFKALPQPEREQMAKDCKGHAHFFVERFSNDRRTWRLCADPSAPVGDPRGLPPAFEAAARAFPEPPKK